MTRRSSLLPTLIMAGLFLILMVGIIDTTFTSKYPGANDFAQRWIGAKAYWVEHLDPYSKTVSLEAEMMLYKAPASTDPALDQYPGDFLYPFNTVILLAPLAFMPYALAEAVWLVLIATSTAMTFLAMADLFNWRRTVWLTLFGILWAITFYPAARGLFLGQIGVIVVCLELITVWALAKNRDVLAGILLAVSTVKPQIGFLIIPFIGLWALRFGRWRFVISFGIGFILLIGLSFLMQPTWLSEWLTQAAQYTGYTRIGSPVWVIVNVYLPFLGGPGEVIIDVLLLILMLAMWGPVLIERDASRFVWTAALTLTITHLIAVRTATPHFVVFLIVLVFVFREITRTNRRQGSRLVGLLMIALSVGLWVLFLTTINGRFEHPINYLPLPFGALIILWLTRRRWWQLGTAERPSLNTNAGSQPVLETR